MRRRGSTIIETAMYLPLIVLLLAGMVEMVRLSLTYFTLQKTMYTLARYLGTQQGVNFCDNADATIVAAKNYALTGTLDGSANSVLPNLTSDLVEVRIERFSGDTQELGECACAISGCDAAAGGLAPDFIVVTIPSGYQVQLSIPFMAVQAVSLRPQVRMPYGGT